MNALVRKEIRLLLPAWIAALLLAIVPCWLIVLAHPYDPSSVMTGVAGPALLFGALLLGLAPFGQEFSAGTFQQLLSQPMARERLWRLKVGVQGVAIVSVLLCGLVSFQIARFGWCFAPETLIEFFAWSACLTLAAVAGGLWTTLLFRQIAAALWFTVLIPLAILLATVALVEKILRLPAESPMSLFCGIVALLLYSAAGLLGARRMFLRAQDTQWTGGTISLPSWLGLRSRRQTEAEQPRRTPFRALLWKEIQAQHVSLLLAAALVVLHLIAIGLRKVTYSSAETNKVLYMALSFWWSLWFGLPFVIGGMAVAEERKLGTLESQLCLPTTRRIQFFIKCGFALFLGVLLGGLMPWLLESLAALLGIPGEFPSMGKAASWQMLLSNCYAAFGIIFVSFYASTLTRNLLQGLGVAIVVGLVLAASAGWAVSGGPLRFDDSYLWLGSLVIYLGLPTLLAVILWLGFRNYKSFLVGWNVWSRNLLAVATSLVFIAITTALVYNRAWEWVIPFDPKHGPAGLNGSVGPEVCSVGRMFGRRPNGTLAWGARIFALLPNGRLWAGSNHRFVELDDKVDVDRTGGRGGHLETAFAPVPTSGIFVGGSNWVQLASAWNNVFGIQSDGSLWKIFSATRTNILENLSAVPSPERMGTNNGWKSIVASDWHCLALKDDGSLWGWGSGALGQLGPGPSQFTNEFVRIGSDADWLKVFAAGQTSVGIKRDGSVWKWGYLPFGPTGFEKGWKQSPRPEPVRWNLRGADWREYIELDGCDLVIKQDGSLWAWGNVRPDLLGYHLFDSDRWTQFRAQPLRVGDASDWSKIAFNSGTLVGLKNSGAIFQFELYGPRLLCWGSARQPSRYSDWLAIGMNSWVNPCLALAADGTLSSWGAVQSYRIQEGRRLLGPSRKPLWTANILRN